MKKLITFILIIAILSSCSFKRPYIERGEESSTYISEINSEPDSNSSEENNTSSIEDSSSEIQTPIIHNTPVPNKVNVWCTPPVVDENTLHPIVIEARKHLGNYNGDMFWQWYGFNTYTAWCACFVSYCAAETNVDIPKFAWVPNGNHYFKSINKWQPRGDYVPKSGDIIFFVYNGWSEACHVGIVECVVGNRVYTIEGNYNNSCQRANYPLNWNTIMGYGII